MPATGRSGMIIAYPGAYALPGGPWPPRLANLLLDGFDKELERRGHQFVRDADARAPRRPGQAAALVTSPSPGGTRDGGRPFGAGWPEQAPNHRQLPWARATGVSVQDTAGHSACQV